MAPCSLNSDLTEKDMSKSNDDTTKTRELTEDELNHVSGGVVRYIDDALGTGVRSEVSMTFALNSHVA